MNLKRILCPIDYSEYSKVANYFASVLARNSGAEILYVHVVYPEYFGGIESETEVCLQELKKIHPFAEDISCHHFVRHGTAADEILEVAREQRVDLIAMGTHGRTGAHRLLHGSVATEVLRRAECPVMAVKLRRR